LGRAAVLINDQKRALWESLGVAYFALGRYSESYRAWRKAYEVENDPTRKTLIKGYLDAADRMMRRPVQPAKRPEPPPKLEVPAEKIRALYNAGVEAYVAGRLDEARKAFDEILTLDPENGPARKALKRVVEEMPAR
jgi:tetratricopeptide (TPR) repeat protein